MNEPIDQSKTLHSPFRLTLFGARGFWSNPGGPVEAVTFLPHLLPAGSPRPSQTLVCSEEGATSYGSPSWSCPQPLPVGHEHQSGHISLQVPPSLPGAHLPERSFLPPGPVSRRPQHRAPRRSPGLSLGAAGSSPSPATNKLPRKFHPLGSPLGGQQGDAEGAGGVTATPVG